MDFPVITIEKPIRVRGGWVVDATINHGKKSDRVRVTMTDGIAAALMKARSGIRIAGDDEDLAIAGLFDRIVDTGKAILANPAVRLAVNQIPYGNQALTVADAGFAVADAARSSAKTAKAVQKQPAPVQQMIEKHRAALAVVRDARAKKPAALQMLRALPPNAAALVKQAQFYESRTDAMRDFKLAAEGDPKALDRIVRARAAKNKNPFAQSYFEALENIAVSEQVPMESPYAEPGDFEAPEVGAKVKRPRIRRPPVIVITELSHLVNRNAA